MAVIRKIYAEKNIVTRNILQSKSPNFSDDVIMTNENSEKKINHYNHYNQIHLRLKLMGWQDKIKIITLKPEEIYWPTWMLQKKKITSHVMEVDEEKSQIYDDGWEFQSFP